MAFSVVLDACVLYPLSLCDILLRLGERELYDLYWSERILEEVRRNLVKNRLTEDQAARRIDAMRRTFPAAIVPEEAIARLEAAMVNEEKDRHVLAAAVESPAEAVITFNLDDFPEEACAPHGVEATHPDDFLLALCDFGPATVRTAIDAQVAALRNPPIPRSELLDMLKRAGVPRFAEHLRARGGEQVRPAPS
ncbi:MAG: PIN domain-containing protein [Candidatus Dormibacter sp.]|uniref:PIN domain-containing protein n=1 Tax=Candidatus Dormibacter sp. TaxID=2973982 RepID=UPI000DB50A8F|nr:MAG: PIN domain-containing protein [Candidatus Dormibacteraeota bacterium]